MSPGSSDGGAGSQEFGGRPEIGFRILVVSGLRGMFLGILTQRSSLNPKPGHSADACAAVASSPSRLLQVFSSKDNGKTSHALPFRVPYESPEFFGVYGLCVFNQSELVLEPL